MTTALVKLREQIIEAVDAGRPHLTKAERLKAAVGRKFDRLVPLGIARGMARPWMTDVTTFVNHGMHDPIVDDLLLATADLRFFLARRVDRTSHSILYDAPAGDGVECFRDATTLLLNLLGRVGTTESWSRCLSISRSGGHNAHRKHLYEASYRGDQAKYAADVLPRSVEAAAVRGGLGHFDGVRIFFYARFATAIGTTGPQEARTPTHVIKVQLDRVHRPRVMRRHKDGSTSRRADGREVHMHGYPISVGELRGDFPVGAAQVLALALPL